MATYAITGTEIVQAVQTPESSVPLIGGKTAFVRVFVMADPARSLTGSLDVQTAGAPVGGIDAVSPGTVTATPTAGRRDSWSDSLNFRLEASAVAPGFRTITVRIRPTVGDPGLPAERRTTLTVWFSPRIDLKVYGVVWAATDSSDDPHDYKGPAAPWAAFEAHREVAENMLPVSSLAIVPMPGIGTEPPKPQPFTNLTTAREWAGTQLATLPDDSIIYLLCNWDFPGLHGLTTSGRVSEGQNNRDTARVGAVMAHELAHALGIPWHSFPEKGKPATPYPRPDGQIADTDFGVRTTRGIPELVGGKAYPDIMDYEVGSDGPWISSFTYLEVFDAITGRLPWQPLGGEIRDGLAVTSWGPGRLDLLARSSDGTLRHKNWDQEGFWAPKGGWRNLGGQLDGALSAVSWGPDRIDVLARGTDGGLYHKYWNGKVWGPEPKNPDIWGSLGVEIDGPIAAVSWATDRLDVFARFPDGTLRHTHWHGTAWGSWDNLGGSIDGPMVAVAPAVDRLDVVARGTDGRLYHKYWNGKVWGPDPENPDKWNPLGGDPEGPIAMCSWGNRRVDLFARFRDGSVRHSWSDGTGWGGPSGVWENLGGGVHERMAAVATGVNRLDVLIQGLDDVVYRKAWDGTNWTPTNTDWQKLGGKIGGSIGAVSWGPQRVDVFVTGTGGGLWHKSRSGSMWAGA